MSENLSMPKKFLISFFSALHLRDINDPEHPYTLEQLKVITEDHVTIDDSRNRIKVNFTPTVEHCSMATLIGLCLRVKLLRALPRRFKVDIFVSPGSHASEDAVNKQLNDKERVAAALENRNLLDMVDKCLSGISPM
ncbi:Protein ae7 [Cymbomonas tetramitiformis]|uniref:Protein ae7 n=1 Tax=Cymbomonas tetramitiformis TaxID=36881 RepID=A0AAE0LHX5_9CHLO|nr:Protein ae7 [Cymbomonas tetramitiformis]KAK3285394.1 Protein ae7 [Cymbomonas tetramitiformis]